MNTINPLLRQILELNRPHGSIGESKLLDIIKYNIPNIQSDNYGNLYLLNNQSNLAFCAHVDTVSRDSNTEIQEIVIDDGIVSLPNTLNKYTSLVLGADNGAGVYLLLMLYKSGLNANFFFFRNEEHGRIGSREFLSNQLTEISHLTQMIAFDRKDQYEIIIEQRSEICASREYALALASELNMNHEPSPHGSFTDSYTFKDYINECLNIAVGYSHAHSSSESLDVNYLETLLDNLKKVNWENLPVIRQLSN